MPMIDVPAPRPHNPNQSEPVLSLVARAIAAGDYSEGMIFLLSWSANEVTTALQDMQLVRMLHHVRDHVDGLRSNPPVLFYNEAEFSALAETYADEHPDEDVPDPDYEWAPISNELAAFVMDELLGQESTDYAIVFEDRVEFFASERYSGENYESVGLSEQLLVQAVAQSYASDDMPAEARSMLNLWSTLRAACWSDMELGAEEILTLPDGAIRVNATIPCLAANRTHLVATVERLRDEHPDLHIDYQRWPLVVRASVTGGEIHHSLTINFSDPDARTTDGREDAVRQALAALPVPVTGDAADGAARVLAGLPEDQAAKVLGVAIIQASTPPHSTVDGR